jgi:hypothetical protein
MNPDSNPEYLITNPGSGSGAISCGSGPGYGTSTSESKPDSWLRPGSGSDT